MTLDNTSISTVKIREIIDKGTSKIYFIGIGGVSMSSLARLSVSLGNRVFGSDIRRSDVTDSLSSAGVEIFFAQNGEGIRKISPDLVVYSLATDSENGDYLAAVSSGALIISRAQMLGAFAERYKSSVAVSGTHGKTTTTYFLSQLFCEGEKNPTCLIGAPNREGSSLIAGGGELLIYESCEYKRSFLYAPPRIQLLLNLELDHTDCYKDLEDIKLAFLRCADNAKDFVILPQESKNLEYVRRLTRTPVISYGEHPDADYRYEIISDIGGVYEFKLFYSKLCLGSIKLSVHGRHNLENAIAAIVCAYHCGVKFEKIKKAAQKLSLPKRRCEKLCRFGGADVIYDYAHHPAEIKATYLMLREMGYLRIAAIFSPHTYSRTKSLMREFSEVLSKFDLTVITEIYPAREKPIEGVTPQALSERIKALGADAYHLDGEDAIKAVSKGYDCILLMGAGDLEYYKLRLCEKD
ncbi:MAG: UDP-N-acetylmuramate--L-alanine ligase [Clostridia bacterium]|nr:UDP-N-acetylmuramate--L-alanine ligase [Clostridia bacterium]